MGIKTGSMMLLAFSLSAFLGAVAGALAAPITTTVYDIGLTLGLKGFVGATLGGLGNGLGAVVGGLLLGIMEAMIAGYVSPAYKDAVPFVLVILILLLVPQGLFGLPREGSRMTSRLLRDVLAMAVVLVNVPLLVPNSYIFDVVIRIGLTAIAVIGLNILMGLAGQISIGHAAFIAGAATPRPS